MKSQIPKNYDVLLECIRDRETGKYYFKKKRDRITTIYQTITVSESIQVLERLYTSLVQRGVIKP